MTSSQSLMTLSGNTRKILWINSIRQKGFSLFITLIALLVMSLAAVALIRSVDTNTVIAGNLAFKQAATASADAAVEKAIAWLQASNNGVTLNNSVLSAGYVASTTNAAADPVGIAYWDSVSASACLIAVNGGCVGAAASSAAAVADTAATDATGNQSAYIIQRLCANPGQPTNSGCVVSAGAVNSPGGTISTTKKVKSVAPTQVYYRILVKVTGPRNTASYVQAIVTM